MDLSNLIVNDLNSLFSEFSWSGELWGVDGVLMEGERSCSHMRFYSP